MAFPSVHAEQLARKIAKLTIRDALENMSIIFQNRTILAVSADTV
jgi:hypothetical protein